MPRENGYLCQNCGYESPKWLGRCPVCGEWNSLKEIRISREGKKRERGERKHPLLLKSFSEEDSVRIATGILELDRVLGGGLPTEALIIIGGEPGVGKSTLALQVAFALARKGKKTLYVSAEESLGQLKERGNRLGLGEESLLALQENDLENIIQVMEEDRPQFVVLDSIQTVEIPDIPSPQGSIAQVRECGSRLLRFAKEKGLTVLIIGHVTKDGTLAGPRTLEHMVDIVLSLEGERTSGLRMLRALKNRYGSTEETGIFEMTSKGLVEVENPSLFFLSEERVPREGVAVVPLLEGKRPILVELQSLVTPSPFSMPQRSCTGYDLRRLYMILALLEKRLSIPMGRSDVFVNVTGGIRIQESAADLAVAVSLVSSKRKRPLPALTVFVGEIGLSGEVRPAKGLKMRLEESRRLGFKRALIPHMKKKAPLQGLETIEVRNLEEAISRCLQ